MQLVIGNHTAIAYATGYEVVESTSLINTGSWIHVLATYDGSSMKMYVNNVLESTKACTLNIVYNSNTSANIGVNNYTTGTYTYHWDGSLSDIRIYNRALNVKEIDTLYNIKPYNIYIESNGILNASQIMED